VRDLGDDFPGIDSRHEVCGGEPCIVHTRIPVWLPEQTRRLGATWYDQLAAYLQRSEIETQLQENEAA
jgi:uncharacterized protein (DUF433 family)